MPEIYYRKENGQLYHSVRGTLMPQEKIQDQIDDGRIQIVDYIEPLSSVKRKKISQSDAYWLSKQLAPLLFKDALFSTDEKTQVKVLGKIKGAEIQEALRINNPNIPAFSCEWTAIDRTKVPMTFEELIAFGMLMGAQVETAISESEKHFAAINALETAEQVEQYNYFE